MDLATLIGLCLGTLVVVAAMLAGGQFGAFFNLPGALLVLGGCLATSFIRFGLRDVLGAARVAGKAFAAVPEGSPALIRDMIELGVLARKNGLITLEQHPIPDEFLRRAIMLCIDGHDAAFVREMLGREVALMVERHEKGRAVFTAMGEAAPAFGLLGTLLGLVRMLAALDQPAAIGPGMAVAVLSTLYGLLAAHLVLLPIADKLQLRSVEEERHRRLVIEGVQGILIGLNPRIMLDSLQAFLPPAEREQTDACA